MPRPASGERKTLDKISIYIPQKKAERYKVMERLRKLAEKKDRSINYLVVDAIIQYLDREEKKLAS
ncbi:MAG: CopG family ribbon-helix-helix protein [Candidatus Bipolaricaulaceae bacterium]